MILRSLPFLFREAWLNIRRHGLMTVASVSTVAIALTILGVFGLIDLQLNVISARLPGGFEIHAFTRTDLKADQVEQLRGRIAALGGVQSVTVIPREAVWAQWKAGYTGLQSDLEGLDNPMLDKLVVRAISPK